MKYLTINNYLSVTNALIRSIFKWFIRIHTNRHITKPRPVIIFVNSTHYSAIFQSNRSTLLLAMEVNPSSWSRYKFRLSKNLVNPVFILSSISGSKCFIPKNVCASSKSNSKSLVENANTWGVVVELVDGWVIFAIDRCRTYMYSINTVYINIINT